MTLARGHKIVDVTALSFDAPPSEVAMRRAGRLPGAPSSALRSSDDLQSWRSHSHGLETPERATGGSRGLTCWLEGEVLSMQTLPRWSRLVPVRWGESSTSQPGHVTGQEPGWWARGSEEVVRSDPLHETRIIGVRCSQSEPFDPRPARPSSALCADLWLPRMM